MFKTALVITYALLSIFGFQSVCASTGFKTTVVFEIPQADNYQRMIADINSQQLNVGRVIFQVNPPLSCPDNTDNCDNPEKTIYYIGTKADLSDSGEYIKNVIGKIPKGVEIYLQPYASPLWELYSPSNAIACNASSACAASQSNVDGLKQVCATINYANNLNALLVQDSGRATVTGIAYDQEGFPITGNGCPQFVKNLIQQNNSDSLKLAWYLHNASVALPANQADLNIIEFYDLYQKAGTDVQCSFDTVAPEQDAIDKVATGCTSKSLPTFPGLLVNTGSEPIFIGGNIYHCSLQQNVGSKYCEVFDQQISPTKYPSTQQRAIAAFNYLLMGDPTASPYPQFLPSSKYGLPGSNCSNTVVMFSTQYIGPMGSSPSDIKTACSSGNGQCSCIRTLASKNPATDKPDLPCGIENGFGVWDESNWQDEGSAMSTFQAVTNQVTSNVLHLDACTAGAPIGIWTYDFIPKSWLPDSSSPSTK